MNKTFLYLMGISLFAIFLGFLLEDIYPPLWWGIFIGVPVFVVSLIFAVIISIAEAFQQK